MQLSGLKPDVRAAGDHGGHDLIRAAAVGKLDLKPFLGEKALADRHVLRRVKHRMSHLAETHGDGLDGRVPIGFPAVFHRAAAGQKAEGQQQGQTDTQQTSSCPYVEVSLDVQVEQLIHARTPHK